MSIGVELCLKLCLKLKLEMAKIWRANHLWKENDPTFYTFRKLDMKDLFRVSSSVVIVEDVLKDLNSIDKDLPKSKVWLIFFHSLEPKALLASKVIRSTGEAFAKALSKLSSIIYLIG